MKRSGILTGLAATVLAIGLALSGCEGPTGADGKGGGTPGQNGSVTQDLSAAQLQTVLDYWTTVYIGADVKVTGSGTVTVAAGRTLSVEGSLELGNGGILLNAALGTLDLSKAAATGLSGESAGTDAVVILPAGFTGTGKVDDSNLTVAPVVDSPDFATATVQAVRTYPLGANAATVIGDGKTLYVLETLNVGTSSAAAGGKVVVLGGGTVSVSGTNAAALADSAHADITAATLINTAEAEVTLPDDTEIAVVTPGSDALTIDVSSGGTLEIGTLNGPNALTLGGNVEDLTIVLPAPGAKLAEIADTLEALTVGSGNLDVTGNSEANDALTFGDGTSTGTVTFLGTLTTESDSTVITVGIGVFTTSEAATVYPAGTVFDPSDGADSVTLGGELALTGDLEISTGGTLLTGTGSITITNSEEVIEISAGATLASGSSLDDTIELKASDGTVVLTTGGTSSPASPPSISAPAITVTKETLATNVLTLTGATIAAGAYEAANATITASTPDLELEFATSKGATLTLEHGGAITLAGAATVTVGDVAVFSGVGSWTAGGSEEEETITIGPTGDEDALIEGSALTATFAADAATANIAVTASGESDDFTLTVKRATLDISGGGGITLKGDGTGAGILTLTAADGDDDGILYLGSGGSALTEGSTGFTITDENEKEAELTPGSGSDPCVVLNSTGEDDGVLKKITPAAGADGVITGSTSAGDAITITNAATVEAVS